jgi:hypothetical protein
MEEGGERGANGDLPPVAPVPEQVHRRSAQPRSRGDGYRVVEPRVRRPGLIEQVDAVPVRGEPARCRDSGFPACLAGKMSGAGVAERRALLFSECRGRSS